MSYLLLLIQYKMRMRASSYLETPKTGTKAMRIELSFRSVCSPTAKR